MTNEEVIEVLEKEESYMLSHGGDRQAKALRIAIDKIEQEPILDKIKEEIKALSPTLTEYDIEYENPVKNAIWEILAEVLFIIDKYREENER